MHINVFLFTFNILEKKNKNILIDIFINFCNSFNVAIIIIIK